MYGRNPPPLLGVGDRRLSRPPLLAPAPSTPPVVSPRTVTSAVGTQDTPREAKAPIPTSSATMSKKGPKAKKESPEQTQYDLRDVVLAKIRGFPAWPAMVVDPESVPKQVAAERPAGKKQNFYCVRFFPVGDYSWVPPKDMSKLKQHEIEAYIAEPHKKSGELLQGYRIALDPQKWEEEVASKQQDAEAEAEEDGENEDEEVDELAAEGDDGEDEVDGEDEGEGKKKSRKRKRKEEAEPKTRKKATPASKKGEKKEKEKSDKPVKGRKNGAAKSKAMIESEDEGDHAGAGPSKKASPPPTKKQRKDAKEKEAQAKEADGEDAELDHDPEAQKVKGWRHRLQRGFLGKSPPKEADMPEFDEIFRTVENAELSLRYLTFSKIGKVMRHIAGLPDDKVPRDDEFHFRERASNLVNRWQQTVSSAKPSDNITGTPVPATNGKTEASDGEGKKEDAGASDKMKELSVGEQTNGDAKVEGATDAKDGSVNGADMTMSEA